MIRLCVLLGVLTLVRGAHYTCEDLVEKMSDCGDLRTTKGFVPHRGLKIAFTIYEDVANNDPNQLPIVLLHGGPGFPSYYMDSLKQMACRGRRVIRYDQGGVDESGLRSGNVSENAPFLLEMEYYPGELEAVLRHLGVGRFHLLGHSWGSVVAQEYALTNPDGLVGLVLVGALSEGRYYIEEQRKTRHSTLPPFLQKKIREIEESQDFESPLYEELNMYLTGLWTMRTMPMPECIEYAFGHFNPEIYVAINGPSEFTISPWLMDWNVTGTIKGGYPSIVFGGEHDTMTHEVLKRVADGIPGARLEIIPNAGHICYVDQPDLFMDKLQDFLLQHDNTKVSRVEL